MSKPKFYNMKNKTPCILHLHNDLWKAAIKVVQLWAINSCSFHKQLEVITTYEFECICTLYRFLMHSSSCWTIMTWTKLWVYSSVYCVNKIFYITTRLTVQMECTLKGQVGSETPVVTQIWLRTTRKLILPKIMIKIHRHKANKPSYTKGTNLWYELWIGDKSEIKMWRDFFIAVMNACIIEIEWLNCEIVHQKFIGSTFFIILTVCLIGWFVMKVESAQMWTIFSPRFIARRTDYYYEFFSHKIIYI